MSEKHVDSIRNLLIARGSLTAVELAQLVGISQPTVSRAIGKTPDILRIGARRGARYALPAALRDGESSWNLYQVNAQGHPKLMGELHALQGGEFYLETDFTEDSFRYLLDGETHPCLFPDLPWFLHDMRPQGYLGRLFAQFHSSELGIGSNPENWTTRETIAAILEYGSDTPGNFILGGKAIDDFQASKQWHSFTDYQERSKRYDELVRGISESDELPGSSAGGEQPKFTTRLRHENGLSNHVIVKFSGSKLTEAGRRWADLLRAEALAANLLSRRNLPSSQTTLVETGERTYLEVERFDRQGEFGRLGVLSLRTLVAARGDPLEQSWPQVVEMLAAHGWLAKEDTTRIAQLWWFGSLIGNTDMHLGNISVYLKPTLPLTLCPIYDMLPMQYAPTRAGDLPSKPISPKLPRPEDYENWQIAASAAIEFWQEMQQIETLDSQIHDLCQENLSVVRKLLESISG